MQAVKNILSQAYADSTQVTDELVECILQPGLQVWLLSSYCPGLQACILCNVFHVNFMLCISRHAVQLSGIKPSSFYHTAGLMLVACVCGQSITYLVHVYLTEDMCFA